MKKPVRKNYLPLPKLQLQLVVVCFFFALCAGLLQHILVEHTVGSILERLPNASASDAARTSSELFGQLLITIGVMFLFTAGVGILLTFRFAGPLFRFEKHLREIAAGEHTRPCRIREGDQFESLCNAINGAVERLTQGEKPAEVEKSAADEEPAADETSAEEESEPQEADPTSA